MKIKYRIPSKDPYGYVEFEQENITETPEEVRSVIDQLEEMMSYHKGETAGPGLPDKEFNTFLDNYLKNNTGELEVFNRMNEEQKKMIQTLKKAFKRLKYNEIE